MIPDMKTCPKCKTEKPYSEYNRCKSRYDGVQSMCRPCSRAAVAASAKKRPKTSWQARLRRNYGLSVEQYEEMLEAQGGVCAICQDTCKTNQRLSVDHCHDTGKIRGLLCRACNAGIGGLGDNADNVRRALSYLEEAERA